MCTHKSWDKNCANFTLNTEQFQITAYFSPLKWTRIYVACKDNFAHVYEVMGENLNLPVPHPICTL